jgi:hypothetical protein
MSETSNEISYEEKWGKYDPHSHSNDDWICVDCRKETYWYRLKAFTCECGSKNVWEKSSVLLYEAAERIAELEDEVEELRSELIDARERK